MLNMPVTEQEFRLLADQAPVMVWRSGLDMACDWFNEPWLTFTGRSMDEELGDGWQAGVHPDDLESCLHTYRSAFGRQEAFAMEYRLRRHDGVYRYILDNGRPYFRDGAFAGYFGSCVDVTTHRETEQQLVQALAERDVLLRELYHRVRNNLQSVLALVRLSMRGADANGQKLLGVLDRRVSAMALAQKSLQALDPLGAIPLRKLVSSAVEDANAVNPSLSIRVGPEASGGAIQAEQGSSFMLGVAEAIAILSDGRPGARLAIEFAEDESVTISADPPREDLSIEKPALLLIRQYARSAGFDSEPREDGGAITFRRRSP
ncbi:hypothetical protein SLNSH_07510 [Alsobacter soli]|uniref:Blue-light-activated histidine kinase n=1 Tax=Alsobacter soli TaxID=2109933 RepID=A0A2T1HVY3_9HYPH|nr:PAS domain S-box protein [Alsobacter soli]PSC05814.1 hypothetical protein SLNSH_07510 [Alsobacter soli]